MQLFWTIGTKLSKNLVTSSMPCFLIYRSNNDVLSYFQTV